MGKYKGIGHYRRVCIKNMKLAPVTRKYKTKSVNGKIRKAISKAGSEGVIVTVYLDSDNVLTKESDITDCFLDADVLENSKHWKKRNSTKYFRIFWN
jgi:hypothetical protein